MSILVKSLPKLPRLYLDAVRQIKKGDARSSLPEKLQGDLFRCPVNPDHISAFSRHAQFDAERIPLSYLYVVTDRSRFALINSKQCPYPAAGLIQTSLAVEIDPDMLSMVQQEFVIRSELSAGDLLDNGSRRITLVTTVLEKEMRDIGSITASYRVRGPKVKGPTRLGINTTQQRASKVGASSADRSGVFSFAANRGRTYAKISGDWNPVHLSSWLAKPFGFKRHILQGLDLVACAEGLRGKKPIRALQVEFEKPVFLPSKVVISLSCEVERDNFIITDAMNEVIHARGTFD